MSQTVGSDAAEMDFATLLEESFKEALPEPGDIVTGTILAIDQQGLLVDVGMKQDGVVTNQDLEYVGDEMSFEIGQRIPVMIVHSGENTLLVSVSQAMQLGDWEKAEALMESGDTCEGEIVDANRGGVILAFNTLRGFIPASHVVDLPQGLSGQERQSMLADLIGNKYEVKVIEVNRKRRRLVFSQREALREQRAQVKERLMDRLEEGAICEGVVSGIRDFGAFVDLGGADGLIHISELAWHRIQHPREVLSVGDKVRVCILNLDHQENRIGLSLKRLQENPWAKVDDLYHIGQLVLGEVTRVESYGAFVHLEPGIEALLHESQVSESPPANIETLIMTGQKLLLRIISIEADRQRLGLSLKEVTDVERENWANEHELDPTSLQINSGAVAQNPVES